MFTICGATGHLSLTQDNTAVDYDSVSSDNLEQLAPIYHYHTTSNPEQTAGLASLTPWCLGAYHLVDPNALNCEITSSALTQSRDDFRKRIVERDGHCIVCGQRQTVSEAAHIIPFGKGDEVCIILLYNCLIIFSFD
jgi:hypothetical protein